MIFKNVAYPESLATFLEDRNGWARIRAMVGRWVGFLGGREREEKGMVREENGWGSAVVIGVTQSGERWKRGKRKDEGKKKYPMVTGTAS